MADYPRVTHPCAAPTTEYCYPVISARLACLNHAASVRSEPESNSPLKNVSYDSTDVQFREEPNGLFIATFRRTWFFNLKTLQLVLLTEPFEGALNLSHNSIFNEQRPE